jgi:hypothetical protein
MKEQRYFTYPLRCLRVPPVEYHCLRPMVLNRCDVSFEEKNDYMKYNKWVNFLNVSFNETSPSFSLTIILRFCTTNDSILKWVFFYPPRGLPPYREEKVCAPPWPGELCWREPKLLVAPPTPDKSKGRDQTKYSPWSSRLGVGRGANDPNQEKFTLTKPSENQAGWN